MPKLYITEYAAMAVDYNKNAMAAGLMPGTAEQSIEIDVVSGQSGPFQAGTKFIMVHADAACSLAFGNDPVASPDYHRLGAEQDRWYGVTAGQRLAVISNE